VSLKYFLKVMDSYTHKRINIRCHAFFTYLYKHILYLKFIRAQVSYYKEEVLLQANGSKTQNENPEIIDDKK